MNPSIPRHIDPVGGVTFSLLALFFFAVGLFFLVATLHGADLFPDILPRFVHNARQAFLAIIASEAIFAIGTFFGWQALRCWRVFP